MTNPDLPENRIETMCAEASTSIQRLVAAAATEGVRHGLEFAAQFCNDIAAWAAVDFSVDSALRDAIAVVTRNLAEQFRLNAHTLQEPVIPHPGDNS